MPWSNIALTKAEKVMAGAIKEAASSAEEDSESITDVDVTAMSSDRRNPLVGRRGWNEGELPQPRSQEVG